MKRLLPILMGFVFLLLSSTEGWSLPPCKGSPSSDYKLTKSWTDCFGTYPYASGSKYVGEWKNGEKHGQGIFTFVDGNKYVGQFKDEKYNGEGIFTFVDGRTEEGMWKNKDFLYAKKLSPTITDKKSPLEKAKEQCAEIGFKKGTEKFGDCVMKLLN